MKNSFYILIILASVLLGICSCHKENPKPQPVAKLYFDETFTDNRNNWGNKITDSVEYKLDSGFYQIRIFKFKDAKNSAYSFFNDYNKFDFNNKDFQIVTKLVKKSESLYGKGIIWGVDSSWTDFNLFYINDYGEYGIFKLQNGAWKTIKEWTVYDTSIPSPITNLLKIDKKNGSTNFYINNKLVHTSENLPAKGQFFGFYTDYFNAVLCADYLQIYNYE